MNPAKVLLLDGGIVSCARRGNPFRPVKRGPLPYLIRETWVNRTPLTAAFGRAADPKNESQAGWVRKVEGFVLSLVAAVFFLAVLGSGLGLQRIHYARAKNQLGRELRQKEQELRALTRALWSLQTETAVEVAQKSAAPETRLARENPGQQASSLIQVKSGPGIKSAPAARAVPAMRGQPPHVMEGRSPARRGVRD